MVDRHRESAYLDARSTLLKTTVNPDSSLVYGDLPGGVFAKSIDDVLTPGFRRLQKYGALPNNPMYLREGRVSTYLGDGVISYQLLVPPFTDTTIIGNVTRAYANADGLFVEQLPDLNVISGEMETLIKVVKLQALAAMDKPLYGFGEDIGEIAETIRFIKSPLKSLSRLLYKFRSTKIKRLKNLGIRRYTHKAYDRPTRKMIGKVTADTWLEYRFAAAPLVRSTYDALLALGHDLVDRPDVRVARGRRIEESNNSFETERHHSSSLTCTFLRKEVHKLEVRAGIRYEVLNAPRDWRRYLALYGVRAKDLPTTAWQLLPLSFMVDRVVDISSMISAGTNLLSPNIKVRSAWVTVKRRMDHSIQLINYDLDGHSSYVVGNTIVTNDGDYNRTTWEPSLLDAVPVVKPFGLISDFTSVYDLLTLCRSRMT